MSHEFSKENITNLLIPEIKHLSNKKLKKILIRNHVTVAAYIIAVGRINEM